MRPLKRRGGRGGAAIGGVSSACPINSSSPEQARQLLDTCATRPSDTPHFSPETTHFAAHDLGSFLAINELSFSTPSSTIILARGVRRRSRHAASDDVAGATSGLATSESIPSRPRTLSPAATHVAFHLGIAVPPCWRHRPDLRGLSCGLGVLHRQASPSATCLASRLISIVVVSTSMKPSRPDRTIKPQHIFIAHHPLS